LSQTSSKFDLAVVLPERLSLKEKQDQPGNRSVWNTNMLHRPVIHGSEAWLDYKPDPFPGDLPSGIWRKSSVR